MPHVLTDLPSQGTKLEITISGTFAEVGNVTSLDGVDAELQMRTVTVLSSTLVKRRPGLPDPGKISGKLLYDPNDTVHAACRAKVTAPPAAPDLFKVIYVDGMTTPANDTFSGYFTKFSPTGIEVNGSLEAAFEIQVTDVLAFNAGAA